MDRHITLREKIEGYLETMNKVEPIINKIYNKDKSIEDIKDIDSTERYLIATKIKLLEDKSEYLEKKSIFEAAVKDYMEEKLSGKKTSINKIAEFYEITPSSLNYEIQRRYDLEEKYQYDRTIKAGGMKISYQKEESLLESLKLQFTSTDKQLLPCSCRTCFLLKLSTFAYEFAKINKIRYPSYWNNDKRADIL